MAIGTGSSTYERENTYDILIRIDTHGIPQPLSEKT